LLDGLCAHPAGDSDTNTPRELIALYCAKIEFFRSLLKSAASVRAGEAAGRPNENSPAGREDRTTGQVFMNSLG